MNLSFAQSVLKDRIVIQGVQKTFTFQDAGILMVIRRGTVNPFSFPYIAQKRMIWAKEC